MPIERTVFICYRRRTNLLHTLAVYNHLEKHGYDVFLDVRTLASGDFERIILRQIAARAHFVVVLTPSALDRCDDPADWLRREIECAIEMKRNIVPLMFTDFTFEQAKEHLRGNLAFLSKYNGLPVPLEYLDEALTRLRHRFLSIPLDTVLHPVPTSDLAEVKQAQQELKAQPDIPEVLLRVENTYEQAIKHLKNGEYRKSIAVFDEVIRQNPQNAEVHLNRGVAWHMLLEYDRAISDFNAAVELNPEDWLALVNRACAFEMKRLVDRALSDYDRAIKLDRSFAHSSYRKAICLQKLGDYDSSIVDFTRAIELDPASSEYYVSRGLSYLFKDELIAGIADVEHALSLQPDSENAKEILRTARKRLMSDYHERSYERYKIGDIEGALQVVSEGLERDSQWAHGYEMRGWLHGLLGDRARELEDYSAAINLDPKNAQYHNNRSVILCDSGDVRDALRDAEVALRLDPENASAYNNRGRALMRLGSLDAAIADFNKAIELDSRNATFYANKGDALALGNDWDQAIESYRAALALNPDYESVRDRIEIAETRKQQSAEIT
jgi:tetratricopeptide (TPR) repeat protein